MLNTDVVEAARKLFPHIEQKKLYLNHASTSPLSVRVVEAIAAYYNQRMLGTLENYQNDIVMVARCRDMVRRLINAESVDRIAFTTSTTEAINIVSSGLPWKHGDRILLNDLDFPANVYPYMNLRRLGVEIDIAKSVKGAIPVETIAGALTPQTRLVALSAVQFLSGYRADLKEIGELCRQRNIIFAVDAIQAIGAVHVDVQDDRIDALATGCQKWQMAPHGAGYLYLTEELQSRIRQQHCGWLGAENPWDFFNYNQPLAATARRYEGGSMNMPSLWGLHAALSTIQEFGSSAIESHILAITEMLAKGLQSIEGVTLYSPEAECNRAGIVTIDLAPHLDARMCFDLMMKRNITLGLRDGKLRYSPHFYNSPGDMEAVIEATRECIKMAGDSKPHRVKSS